MRKEKELRRELLPSDPWDAGAVEQWLEDRAAEGWMIEELGCRFAAFRRMEPRKTRFRCEPVGNRWGHPEKEQEELYAETGWHYVGLRNPGYSWYRVWRCSDPAAPELETDAETEKYAYRWLLRRSVWRVVWPWLLLMAVLMWVAWSFSKQTEPVQHLIYGTDMRLVLALVTIPLALWESWRELRAVRYLRRMVTAGVPLPHSGDWRKNRRRSRWNLAIWTVWMVLVIGYPFWQIGASRAADGEPLPCVTCEMLRPKLTEVPIQSENVIVNAFLLAPRSYDAWQDAGNGERVSAELDILRFRKLAEALWRERTDQVREAGELASEMSFDDPRFDGAALLTMEDGRQFFAAWRGRLVLTEWSRCGVDLGEHLDDFAAVLDRYE